MDFSIPAGCLALIDRLSSCGYPSYLVGGCVRDLCRGVTPHDYDLTTSATPDEMKTVFRGFRVIETGIAHGTLTVLSDGVPYEVTTYRIDGDYTDGRHPDAVIFTPSLERDLARRDFTVNAMAYSPADGLIDPFGGQADLDAKIIRAVGEPERRFREDSLRILRALRFASTLGFTIEFATAVALAQLAPTVSRVSPERIREELLKLLSGASSGRVLKGYRDALFAAVPTLSPIGERWDAVALAASRLSSDPVLALAALGYPLGGEATAALFRTLKTDRKSEKRATLAVSAYGERLPTDLAAAARFLIQYGENAARDAVSLARAYENENAEAAGKAIEAFFKTGRPITLSGLAVRGDDLTAVGIPAGPALKETLARLLDLAAKGEVENEKNARTALAVRLQTDKTAPHP